MRLVRAYVTGVIGLIGGHVALGPLPCNPLMEIPAKIEELLVDYDVHLHNQPANETYLASGYVPVVTLRFLGCPQRLESVTTE